MQIDAHGSSKSLETFYLPAEHNTIADIGCPFPHNRKKRDIKNIEEDAFVISYKIAISNNAKSFSDGHPIYILDSTCQDTMNVSGELKFVLKVRKFNDFCCNNVLIFLAMKNIISTPQIIQNL